MDQVVLSPSGRRVRSRGHTVRAYLRQKPRFAQYSDLGRCWGPVHDMIYSSPWTRPLLIPSYFALASVVVLILQALFSSGLVKRLWLRVPIGAAVENESEGVSAGESCLVRAGGSSDSARTGLVSAIKDYVERSGGSTIFLFHLAHLGLSIFFFLREEEWQQQQQQPSSIDSAGLLRVHSLRSASKHWMHWQKPKHKHGHGGGSFSERE